MALIVEDGSNVAGAESYCSVADASAYHTAQGNAAWGALASDTVREQNLRKATAYMVQMYRFAWAGIRQHEGQSLDWPRANVPKVDVPYLNYVAQDSVPLEVKNACAELALRAASGALLGDLSQAKTRVKVGPIETEYDRFSPQTKRYPAVDAMLAPYFKGAGSGGMRVIRA